MLARLSTRYASRHKAQTARAVLGLLVATAVLAAGLGLGESVGTSLERAALARFGDVEIVVTGSTAFDTALPARLANDPAVQPYGVQGVGTAMAPAAVVHTAKGLAEAHASVRGIDPREARTLGPLVDIDGKPVAEPRRGEAIITDTLAGRISATVGDRILVVAQPRGFEPDVAMENFTGVAQAPPPLGGPHTFDVTRDAFAFFAGATWFDPGTTVTVEARSPSGIAYANRSSEGRVSVTIEPPIEKGAWQITVRSDRPTPYLAAAGAAYVPPLANAVARLETRVAAIVPEEGRAGITGTPAVLVPLPDLQSALGIDGLATHAYFTADRDPRAAALAIENALARLSEQPLQARAVKVEMLERAEEAGREITGFLLVMGGFTLVAAILLAFTLFSALVEERRAELGIARALGLTRGEVALMMTLEGALYAGVAALVGLGVGSGLVAILMRVMNRVATAEGGPTLAMHVAPGTLATAFSLGVLLPLVTIAASSLRFARLDPARAIRGIPDDPKGRRRLGLGIGLALAILGALLSLSDLSALVGVPIALAGAAVIAGSRSRPRIALGLAAAAFAHVGWTLYTFEAWPESAGELDPILTMTRGALLALGASALAVAWKRPLQGAERLLATRPGTQRASFVALKYLMARRRPAGLTIAMISIVVVVVIVMGTLTTLFSGSITTEEAGYEVLGESILPLASWPSSLPPDVAPHVSQAHFLARHFSWRPSEMTRDGQPVGPEWGFRAFIGTTPGFARDNGYELRERAAAYPDDRAAWEAVSRGEAILLTAWIVDNHGPHVGDRVDLSVGGRAATSYLVAGSVSNDWAWGTFVAADHVRAMGFPTGTVALLRVAPGGDPDFVAHRLTAAYAGDGLTFVSIPEDARRVSTQIQAFILVFESFLALGLFVGLASTGFLASRAVHERMRDIGTLRALGFEERDVRRAFVLESTATAGMGLLIGTTVGLIVAHSVWWREIRSERIAFTPPWLILIGFAIAVLGLAALASRGPAKRASRLPPAIAVRHVE